MDNQVLEALKYLQQIFVFFAGFSVGMCILSLSSGKGAQFAFAAMLSFAASAILCLFTNNLLVALLSGIPAIMWRVIWLDLIKLEI
ncbi:hypothetical protein KA078_00390 [Candidatus Woesebacteria bacterium]|nr:hypothetical protein [Candidatus Woesebacteria bacterium]